MLLLTQCTHPSVRLGLCHVQLFRTEIKQALSFLCFHEQMCPNQIRKNNAGRGHLPSQAGVTMHKPFLVFLFPKGQIWLAWQSSLKMKYPCRQKAFYSYLIQTPLTATQAHYFCPLLLGHKEQFTFLLAAGFHILKNSYHVSPHPLFSRLNNACSFHPSVTIFNGTSL